MNTRVTAISGLFLIEPEPVFDDRGSFARCWDRADLEPRGVNVNVNQVSVSYNKRRGTLRGLHLQHPPHEETKTVRCTSGAVFDVAVDLRLGSPTYRQWFGVELSAENRISMVIPEGCAHGYVTLRDATEVMYQISVPYVAEFSTGFRWDDPSLGIEWPIAIRHLSERDSRWPLLGDPAS